MNIHRGPQKTGHYITGDNCQMLTNFYNVGKY